MTIFGRKIGRRTIALFWFGVIPLISGILIAVQQIPILYVLATLALVVLLLIVAFADLENVSRQAIDES